MKSILIIDTPNNCSECQFCGFGGRNLEKYVCCLTKEHSEEPHLVGCPLKPMPSKKKLIVESKPKNYFSEYAEGWNACVRAVMGVGEFEEIEDD